MSDFENKQWELLEQLLANVGLEYFALSGQNKELLQWLFFNKKSQKTAKNKAKKPVDTQ